MFCYFHSNWGISTNKISSNLYTIIFNVGFTIVITDKLEQHTEYYSKLQQWAVNWLLLIKVVGDIKMVKNTITTIQNNWENSTNDQQRMNLNKEKWKILQGRWYPTAKKREEKLFFIEVKMNQMQKAFWKKVCVMGLKPQIHQSHKSTIIQGNNNASNPFGKVEKDLSIAVGTFILCPKVGFHSCSRTYTEDYLENKDISQI